MIILPADELIISRWLKPPVAGSYLVNLLAAISR
jgi:hypothetical protein